MKSILIVLMTVFVMVKFFISCFFPLRCNWGIYIHSSIVGGGGGGRLVYNNLGAQPQLEICESKPSQLWHF